MYVRNLSTLIAAALAASTSLAWSQATLDHLLGTVNVNGLPSCSTIEIKLNRPVTVISPQSFEPNTDLIIRLEPLATTLPSEAGQSFKEAASVAPTNPAGAAAVIFDPASTQGPIIHLVFAKAVSAKYIPDQDTRHIILKVASSGSEASCLGVKAQELPNVKAQALPSVKTESAAKGDAPPIAPGQDAQSALTEGKKLLNAGEFNRATAFFTKAIGIGSGRVKQDAQEMLGLSRERANQMAFAKSEYETYLKAYPGGADGARVRDRLNGVVAAMENTANKEFDLRRAKLAGVENPTPLTGAKGDKTAVNQTLTGKPGTGLVQTSQGMKTSLRDAVPDPKAWVWQKNGSWAQYYYRDDNFVPVASVGQSGHRVYQNEVQSSLDFSFGGSNDEFATEMRLSTYYEKGFGDQASIDNKNLSTVYVDGKWKTKGIGLRLGRQSKSTGGVFGRFDGAVGTYEPLKDLKIQAVGGSPVYSRSSDPFADNRYFFGASVEYTLPSREWAGSVYAIQQNIREIVDRRAIGGDIRYLGKTINGFGAADYDLFYGQLNNAYVSATWLPRDGTTLYGTVDFRRVPFLLTSNALMGQNYSKLTTLVDDVGLESVNQWATDRTATSETLTIGGTQNLSTDWQLSIDATVANYSGTPASGTVLETPSPGIEYYGSVQLSGSNLFRENDSGTFGLRYSGGSSSSTYMADASFRIPVTDNLRFGPRIRTSVSVSKTTNQQTYLVMPSVNARYKINKQWSLEGEIGARWQDTVTPTSANINVDVIASMGYRFEF
jgi:hypothetical protein